MAVKVFTPAVERGYTFSKSSATNSASTITLTAVPNKFHALHQISWSITGTTPVTALTVSDAGNVIFALDLVATGADSVVFPVPLVCALANTALVISATAGGSGVVVKLNTVSSQL